MSAIRTLAAAVTAGLPLERAIQVSAVPDGEERAIVDTIIDFARHTGVPRAGVLAALADSVDASERRARAITTGSASARQTARILTLLPFATAIGAQSFGFDVFAVVTSTPLGWACLVVGTALAVVAQWWMRRIREELFNPAPHVGLILDLAAGVARTSAVSPSTVERLRHLAVAWGTVAEMEVIDSCRRLSRETGVPISGLLAVSAATKRHRAHDRVAEELELLPGKLLAPVGACLFPAFVVMTVIPVVASMMSGWSN